MRVSLRVQLLVMFMLVVLVAVGAVAVFASQTTAGAFHSYIDRQQASDQQLISQILTTYNQTHDPQKVQVLVEQAAQTAGARIIVVDHSQHVIADSKGQLTGQVLTLSMLFALESPGNISPESSSPAPDLPPPPPRSAVRIISTDSGNVSFGPVPLALGPHPPEENFLASVNSSLLEAFFAAGIVALLLTLVLSNTILKPVRELTLAASRMEQGDLSQRVQIKTKDEIGDLAHAFNTMADSLERSEQLRRNLVSDVAHELRTPLTNIRGYLEALQDQVISDTSRGGTTAPAMCTYRLGGYHQQRGQRPVPSSGKQEPLSERRCACRPAVGRGRPAARGTDPAQFTEQCNQTYASRGRGPGERTSCSAGSGGACARHWGGH